MRTGCCWRPTQRPSSSFSNKKTYKRKFDDLKEITDSLNLQNTETSQTIRGSNNDLEVLMDVKKNYKALKPEKTVLMRQSPHPKKRVTPRERRDITDET